MQIQLLEEMHPFQFKGFIQLEIIYKYLVPHRSEKLRRIKKRKKRNSVKTFYIELKPNQNVKAACDKQQLYEVICLLYVIIGLPHENFRALKKKKLLRFIQVKRNSTIALQYD